MKICILAVLHPPFDKRVFHKEAKSLVNAGHDVHFITPSDTPVPATDGVTFECIPARFSTKERLKNVWRLLRMGRRTQCDAYMAVEPESWVAALVLKLVTGRKVVFDVHEHIPSSFANYFPAHLRPMISVLTTFAMRQFARFTDEIVLTRASLEEPFMGLQTPRTLVINTNHLQPPCADISSALREKYADRPTIIHQGLFGDVRGSYQLLDALDIVRKDVPDLKCIVLGKYAYGDEAKFRDTIRKRGLTNVVDLIDEVPFHEVPAYIAVSKVGLILFQPIGLVHTLGMPHKLFDYMREGVPVVVPEFALEIRRIVNETKAGILVDVTDPADIAAAILRLLTDCTLAETMGRDGRKAIEENYNWAADERRLLDVFERVAPR